MNKIIPIVIAGILLCTAFGAVALNSDERTLKNTNQGGRDFTHVVFAEYGTATWCSYCRYAHGALKEIYAEAQYPFFYVSLVTDKNTKASTRCLTDYNAYGWPTMWFDGGYKVNVGASSVASAKAAYITSINSCGSRAVENVDVSVSGSWLGGTNMEIQATVTNNEASTYGGHIRVYITELVTSMGWIDYGGQPYTFPFLDFAFDQALSIPAGNSWSDTVQWDGTAHGFSTITEENIMIIAAVFNDEAHQGYSYPPTSNPFTAYYVDDAIGYMFGGNGPYTPSSPTPANGATNVDLNADLSWKGGGTPGLTITYDVYFGVTSSPSKVSSNQSAKSYDPGTMSYETAYYWKIVAWDQNGNFSEGPLWHFTTLKDPNVGPNPPTITGTEEGKPGAAYKYTFSATDPESDMIYGFVDWGDNTTTDWVGPYSSGASFYISHSWAEKGDYTIRAKVRDEHGAESGWATLTVTMPTSLGIPNTFFQWLFEQFPHAFPILRHLLGM
jgi:hypothetical protein